jgi:hypothetical protein
MSTSSDSEKKQRTVRWIQGLWVLTLIIIGVRVALSPNKGSVFPVFVEAGRRWLAGAPLYPKVGEFLYSPLVAAFFAPFSLLPNAVSGILWRVISVLIYYAAVSVWLNRLYPKSRHWLGLLLLLVCSVGNINNGQASIFILGLVGFALIAIDSRRWNIAAILFALAAFFKIYPLVFGLLVCLRYPGKMIWRLLAALGLCFVLSLLAGYGHDVWSQYGAWFSNLGSDSRRLADGVGHWRDFWLLLKLAHVPITVLQYAVLQVLGGAVIAAFCFWGNWVWKWSAHQFLESVLVLGGFWIVLLGPSTELATYVFLAPAFATVVCALDVSETFSGLRLWFWICFLWHVLADVSNAWVPFVRRSLTLHGLNPIGALLFLAVVVAWLFQSRGPNRARSCQEDKGRAESRSAGW